MFVTRPCVLRASARIPRVAYTQHSCARPQMNVTQHTYSRPFICNGGGYLLSVGAQSITQVPTAMAVRTA
jgi:hypothetical protein